MISESVSRSWRINLKIAFPVPPQSIKERKGIWVENTNSEIIADDIELIIYGCGDGVCESGLENTSFCPEDCQ